MRLKEHEPGCMCDACQGEYQMPVDDISGYDSGFELTPDPNQEVSMDPDFISSIVQQVLQQMQMGGGDMEEQLDPFAGEEFTQEDNMASTSTQAFNPNFLQGGGIGPVKPIKFNPCGLPHKKDKALAMKEIAKSKIREYISSQVKELYEGSCGYSQSATGESLKTPGGTNGIDAFTRTNKMKKKDLEENVPFDQPNVQTSRTYKGDNPEVIWKPNKK